jgi:hypothetical protein
MVRNVFGGGDQACVTVELVAVAECKSGMFLSCRVSVTIAQYG